MKKEKPNDWARLMHMKDAAEKIAEFIEGLDEESFIHNEMVLLAVNKLIEIIGEAAYHVSDDLKKNHNNISWKQIQGMRHRLVHDYYEIDAKIVWRVASVYVPQFLTDVRPILENFE